MTDDVAEVYRARYDSYLQRIATNLERLVVDHLSEARDIDRVTARAKDPERFAEKAARLDPNGRPRYQQPLTEVQDQVGVRVVVFYEETVNEVAQELHRYFQLIEEKTLIPESHWEFGYFGHHSVVALPRDVVPADVNVDDAPRFLEVQIKTLFQHAWSEANHDLGYKAPAPLSGDQQRLLAFAAAQAWGADRAFEELRAQLASA